MEHYLAIDLGGSSIKVAVVGEDLSILSKETAPTKPWRPPSEIVSDIVAAAKKALFRANIGTEDIVHIGIGSPGMCDNESGVLVRVSNINLSGFHIRAEFKKYFGKPVFLGNDANCAALGEYLNLENKVSTFVLITLGTGIGSGIIIDGKLHIGLNGLSGEIGHMCIVKDGIECPCGRRGCFEQYASVNALVRMAKTAMQSDKSSLLWEIAGGDTENIDGKSAFIAKNKGDMTAAKVLDEWINYLGEGLLNIVNILQPDIILIGGAVSSEGEALIKPLQEYIFSQRYCEYPLHLGITKIGVAKLGNDAGLIGAAMLGKYYSAVRSPFPTLCTHLP